MSIRTIPLVLVAAAAMALAAPAMAKEIEEAAVCGADGCAKVTPRGNAHAMLDASGVTDAPKPAPFYRVRLGIGDGTGKVFERFTILWVPSAEKMRAMDGQWVNTTTAADRALARVTQGHEPLPAKKLNRTEAEQDAQTMGTSLPPEVVLPPDDGPGSGSGGGGVPGWLIVLGAGGGLVLVAGGAAWALRRRTEGGGEAAVAP